MLIITKLYERYRDLKFLFKTWKHNSFNSNLNARDVLKLMLKKCISHASKFNFNHLFDEYSAQANKHHLIIIKFLNLANQINRELYQNKVKKSGQIDEEEVLTLHGSEDEEELDEHQSIDLENMV